MIASSYEGGMCRSGVYGIDPRLPASLVASLIAATSATRSGEEARASFPGVASGLVERVERVGERADAGAPRPYSWGVWMRAAISHVRPRDLVERARGVRSRRGAISYFAIVCIDNKQRPRVGFVFFAFQHPLEQVSVERSASDERRPAAPVSGQRSALRNADAIRRTSNPREARSATSDRVSLAPGACDVPTTRILALAESPARVRGGSRPRRWLF